MRMHDIICDADGWAHCVDGVKQRTFPTWFMAMAAARKAAERDVGRGVAASFRYQGADGQMLPVQNKAQAKPSPAEAASETDATTPEAQWERARMQA